MAIVKKVRAGKSNKMVEPKLTKNRNPRFTHLVKEKTMSKSNSAVYDTVLPHEAKTVLKLFYLNDMINGEFNVESSSMSIEEKQAFEEFGPLTLEEKKEVKCKLQAEVDML